MKKEYIKPEMLVEEFISDIYMQITSIPEGEEPVIPLSNERQSDRGTWGDLWD